LGFIRIAQVAMVVNRYVLAALVQHTFLQGGCTVVAGLGRCRDYGCLLGFRTGFRVRTLYTFAWGRFLDFIEGGFGLRFGETCVLGVFR
jgi:hypothetical protein